MTTYTKTEELTRASFTGNSFANEISCAIDRAIEMSCGGQINYTVARTHDGETKIYSDFQLRVGRDAIAEAVYSTDCGYLYQRQAA